MFGGAIVFATQSRDDKPPEVKLLATPAGVRMLRGRSGETAWRSFARQDEIENG